MSSSEHTRVPLHEVDRGEAGRVLRELRAEDFVFTVLETERLTDHYQRIRFAGNGFLAANPPYPTMWVRLWFEDISGSGQGHQRAYTLVNPDKETDTFWLEFAMHDGIAPRWAESAQPGQQIEASLYGSEPSLPSCAEIDTHLLIGDTASLPAINSLLDALSASPAVVVLEWVHESDRTLPVRIRPQDRVRWVRRERDGQAVLTAVAEELQEAGAWDRTASSRPNHFDSEGCTRIFAWGACDTATTRALTKQLKAAGLRRDCIKTLGYWLPPKENLALTG